ncbi:basic salivary proline-rich protein 2-like [Aquila chrysaetos chrysaetos]|uniref:basic salivary proline-rich protein 2-like n=1 Tax=Aquila chrysaetos chrysaetos TaxID=223781 RepID=UPI00117666FD|nr:basic salivary proline-rich protein 2-like [Aquila chrysaetos chrysaetos]
MRGGGFPCRARPSQAEGAPPRPEPPHGHDAEAARGEPRASPARRELWKFGPWGPWLTLGPKSGSRLGRRALQEKAGGGGGLRSYLRGPPGDHRCSPGQGLQRLLPNARRPGGRLCLRGEAGSTALTGPDPALGSGPGAPSVRCLPPGWLRPSPRGSAPGNRELPPPPRLSRTLSAAPSPPPPHLRALPAAGLPQPLGGLSSSSPPPTSADQPPPPAGAVPTGSPAEPRRQPPPQPRPPGNGGFVWNPIQTTP